MKIRWMKPNRNIIRSLLGVWLTSSDDISVSFDFIRGNRDPLHHCGLARRIYEKPATCKHQMQFIYSFISAFKYRRTHYSVRVLEESLVSGASALHCCFFLSRQPEDAHHPMLWSTRHQTDTLESRSRMRNTKMIKYALLHAYYAVHIVWKQYTVFNDIHFIQEYATL